MLTFRNAAGVHCNSFTGGGDNRASTYSLMAILRSNEFRTEIWGIPFMRDVTDDDSFLIRTEKFLLVRKFWINAIGATNLKDNIQLYNTFEHFTKNWCECYKAITLCIEKILIRLFSRQFSKPQDAYSSSIFG